MGRMELLIMLVPGPVLLESTALDRSDYSRERN
jgi:hypothetical protein